MRAKIETGNVSKTGDKSISDELLAFGANIRKKNS